jgi:flagellar hook-associated protein 1 FlgK
LLDERDRLIDSVASAVGVTTTYDPRGVATLRVAGPSAELLADAGTAATIGVTAAANGTLSFSVSNGTTSALTPTTGRLAGLTRAAADLSTKRTELDAVASQFVTNINTAHQAGIDANGDPGGALLTIGASAASVVAIALTPDKVAAADGSSENGNILAFASLRGAGGSEASWAALVAQQAQVTASARAQDAAATTRQNGADEARSALSSIDLDREAADLLRYQQAYEGAARTIQVARETLQTILNLF